MAARRLLNAGVLLLVLLGAPRVHAGNRVVVYGAGWCGPCRAVKSHLKELGVPFDYLDIDEEGNREAFESVTGDRGGIPLTLIDNEKVRGARLNELRLVLERRGVKTNGKAARPTGGEVYGDHAAAWWQQQFVDLRRRVSDLKQRIERVDREAVFNDEKAVRPRLEQDLKILQASLDDLEADASRVSLPRKYRAY